MSKLKPEAQPSNVLMINATSSRVWRSTGAWIGVGSEAMNSAFQQQTLKISNKYKSKKMGKEKKYSNDKENSYGKLSNRSANGVYTKGKSVPYYNSNVRIDNSLNSEFNIQYNNFPYGLLSHYRSESNLNVKASSSDNNNNNNKFQKSLSRKLINKLSSKRIARQIPSFKSSFSDLTQTNDTNSMNRSLDDKLKGHYNFALNNTLEKKSENGASSFGGKGGNDKDPQYKSVDRGINLNNIGFVSPFLGSLIDSDRDYDDNLLEGQWDTFNIEPRKKKPLINRSNSLNHEILSSIRNLDEMLDTFDEGPRSPFLTEKMVENLTLYEDLPDTSNADIKYNSDLKYNSDIHRETYDSQYNSDPIRDTFDSQYDSNFTRDTFDNQYDSNFTRDTFDTQYNSNISEGTLDTRYTSDSVIGTFDIRYKSDLISEESTRETFNLLARTAEKNSQLRRRKNQLNEGDLSKNSPTPFSSDSSGGSSSSQSLMQKKAEIRLEEPQSIYDSIIIPQPFISRDNNYQPESGYTTTDLKESSVSGKFGNEFYRKKNEFPSNDNNNNNIGCDLNRNQISVINNDNFNALPDDIKPPINFRNVIFPQAFHNFVVDEEQIINVDIPEEFRDNNSKVGQNGLNRDENSNGTLIRNGIDNSRGIYEFDNYRDNDDDDTEALHLTNIPPPPNFIPQPPCLADDNILSKSSSKQQHPSHSISKNMDSNGNLDDQLNEDEMQECRSNTTNNIPRLSLPRILFSREHSDDGKDKCIYSNEEEIILQRQQENISTTTSNIPTFQRIPLSSASDSQQIYEQNSVGDCYTSLDKFLNRNIDNLDYHHNDNDRDELLLNNSRYNSTTYGMSDNFIHSTLPGENNNNNNNSFQESMHHTDLDNPDRNDLDNTADDYERDGYCRDLNDDTGYRYLSGNNSENANRLSGRKAGDEEYDLINARAAAAEDNPFENSEETFARRNNEIITRETESNTLDIPIAPPPPPPPPPPPLPVYPLANSGKLGKLAQSKNSTSKNQQQHLESNLNPTSDSSERSVFNNNNDDDLTSLRITPPPLFKCDNNNNSSTGVYDLNHDSSRNDDDDYDDRGRDGFGNNLDSKTSDGCIAISESLLAGVVLKKVSSNKGPAANLKQQQQPAAATKPLNAVDELILKIASGDFKLKSTPVGAVIRTRREIKGTSPEGSTSDSSDNIKTDDVYKNESDITNGFTKPIQKKPKPVVIPKPKVEIRNKHSTDTSTNLKDKLRLCQVDSSGALLQSKPHANDISTKKVQTTTNHSNISEMGLDVSKLLGYQPINDDMPPWKKALNEKKNQLLLEKAKRDIEEFREKEEKWKDVPEWKRQLMMEKEKKKIENPITPQFKKNSPKLLPVVPTKKTIAIQ